MRVLSINISHAKRIEHQGKPVHTGIFKTPARKPLQVTGDGIEGDVQCDLLNHGGVHKAVYAFSMEHYPYWRQTLDKPGLEPGAFGENLTLDDLDEGNICIGDQLTIGDALLEVSQPRVPCFKLGIALGDDRAPALFTRNFHTGVYFRVLRAGTINEGDSATIASRHPAGISVHALFRAYYDRSYEGRIDLLRAAAAVAELAPEWRDRVF